MAKQTTLDPFTIEEVDVENAVKATLNVLVPTEATQTAITAATWANQATPGGFAKAFSSALSDPTLRLGFDTAQIAQLTKAFELNLPRVQRKRLEEATKTEKARADSSARTAATKAEKAKEAKSVAAQAIQTSLDLIEDDWKAANEVNSAASKAEERAQELFKEFPSVKTEADSVVSKVKDVKDAFQKLEAARRAAKIAAPSGDKVKVDDKVKEVDDLRKEIVTTLYEAVKTALNNLEEAAEKKRFFKEIIGKIEALKKSTANFLEKANEGTAAAVKIRDEANKASSGWLDWVKVNIFHLSPVETDADKAFNARATALTELGNADTDVGAALTEAKTADTTVDKPKAEKALADAEAAVKRADTADKKIAEANKELTEAGTKKAKTPSGRLRSRIPVFAAIAIAFVALGIAALSGLPGWMPGWILGLGLFVTLVATAYGALFPPERTLGAVWVVAVVMMIAAFVALSSGSNASSDNDQKGNGTEPTTVVCRTGWFNDPCKTPTVTP